MKIKNIISLGILIFLSLSVTAQPVIDWQHALGGSGSDSGSSIIPTNDGGYISVVATKSNDGDVFQNNGGSDVWVVKLSSTGIIEWEKSYGGSNNDTPAAIRQTTDGGYIVVGSSASDDGDLNFNFGELDYWVFKVTSTGTIEWQKTYGGSATDIAESIEQTSDGGFIVTGKSNSNDGNVFGNHGSDDIWLVKLTSIGAISWERSLGGSDIDYSYSIQQTNDGGYIVAGTTESNDGDVTSNLGDYDYWLVKLNSTGLITWENSYGGSDDDFLRSVQLTSDGGYIICGETWSDDGNVVGSQGTVDLWVVKLTSVGLIEWKEILGGVHFDFGGYIQQTSDGGYIVGGSTFFIEGDMTSNNGGVDYWFIKLTNSGQVSWQRSFGGSANDLIYDIQQASDGGYIATGRIASSNGDVTGYHGGVDSWVVKISVVVGLEDNNEELELGLYPNPVMNQLRLKVASEMVGSDYTIYDYNGKSILTGNVTNENTIIELNDWSNGIYLVEIQTENGTVTSRFVKE